MHKKIIEAIKRHKIQKIVKKRTIAFMKRIQKGENEMKHKFSLDLLLR